MRVQYKKLWKILIDRDMSKQDLSKLANVSGATLTKLRKGENVNMDILIRICTALGCGIDDILEMLPYVAETKGKQSS